MKIQEQSQNAQSDTTSRVKVPHIGPRPRIAGKTAVVVPKKKSPAKAKRKK